MPSTVVFSKCGRKLLYYLSTITLRFDSKSISVVFLKEVRSHPTPSEWVPYFFSMTNEANTSSYDIKVLINQISAPNHAYHNGSAFNALRVPLSKKQTNKREIPQLSMLLIGIDNKPMVLPCGGSWVLNLLRLKSYKIWGNFWNEIDLQKYISRSWLF